MFARALLEKPVPLRAKTPACLASLPAPILRLAEAVA